MYEGFGPDKDQFPLERNVTFFMSRTQGTVFEHYAELDNGTWLGNSSTNRLDLKFNKVIVQTHGVRLDSNPCSVFYATIFPLFFSFFFYIGNFIDSFLDLLVPCLNKSLISPQFCLFFCVAFLWLQTGETGGTKVLHSVCLIACLI